MVGGCEREIDLEISALSDVSIPEAGGVLRCWSVIYSNETPTHASFQTQPEKHAY